MHGVDCDSSERAGDSQSIPQLVTKDELARFFGMPEISAAKDQDNVIAHLRGVEISPGFSAGAGQALGFAQHIVDSGCECLRRATEI